MKQNILFQIDHDDHCSAFDSVVAIDSGVDHLLTFPQSTPIQMQSIIHGGIFTRGPSDLKHTAIFFGGSNVEKTTELFQQAQKHFFGPMQISMMSDPNGSNTTAAAAVICARKTAPLKNKKVVVLAATGPVGQRICQLTSSEGANVIACSRSLNRAEAICESIGKSVEGELTPFQAATPEDNAKATEGADFVFAAGAAGIELLDERWLETNQSIQVAVDINAVPPSGIAGVEVMDNQAIRHGKTCFGAIGVGQSKMKIHKACIKKLFESNQLRLDTEEIFNVGLEVLEK
ncbi:MAG: methylene-tetrahydromethanopterin dehydrogenase N-terminal domain-containing protein [Planctomycetota bacterium]